MENVLEEKIDKIMSDLNNAPWLKWAYDFHQMYLTECLKYVNNEGMWLEFGVYRGRTISFIASKTQNTVYGFDSFEGLHEFWDKENPKGVYSLAGVIPEGTIDDSIVGSNPGMYDSSPTRNTKPWAKNIKLIKGYFEDTLPTFLKENLENVAFVHIDSDLYSSAKTVLDLLKNRIKPGTMICFDDLMEYSINQNNEIKAFAEFLIETNFDYDVIACQKFPGSTYIQGCFIIK